MEKKITIPGSFPGLNEFIDANRTGKGRWNKGNSMKRRDQKEIAMQIPRFHMDGPVWIDYAYFCPNRRKDLDNIAGYFHKVFQDALVERHVIPDDDWKHVVGFSDRFYLDRANPRIEVTVRDAPEL